MGNSVIATRPVRLHTGGDRGIGGVATRQIGGSPLCRALVEMKRGVTGQSRSKKSLKPPRGGLQLCDSKCGKAAP